MLVAVPVRVQNARAASRPCSHRCRLPARIVVFLFSGFYFIYLFMRFMHSKCVFVLCARARDRARPLAFAATSKCIWSAAGLCDVFTRCSHSRICAFVHRHKNGKKNEIGVVEFEPKRNWHGARPHRRRKTASSTHTHAHVHKLTINHMAVAAEIQRDGETKKELHCGWLRSASDDIHKRIKITNRPHALCECVRVSVHGCGDARIGHIGHTY